MVPVPVAVPCNVFVKVVGKLSGYPGLKCQISFTYLDEDFYRLQRSCEGYVFTGVCLSTGGRGGISACLAAGIGWCGIPACLAAGLQGGAVVSQHALQQVSGGGMETPRQQMATVTDCTHPTGMHSCWKNGLLMNHLNNEPYIPMNHQYN